MIKGIDVSSYQGTIDWDSVRGDSMDFVIIRSIIRNGKPDSRFEEYYKMAAAAGFNPDVYVYMYDTTIPDTRERIRKVIRLLKGKEAYPRVWLDMEEPGLRTLSAAHLTELILDSAAQLEAAGYAAGIYCNKDWYDHVLEVAKLPYPFWIARYGKNDGCARDKYRPEHADIWQYTSKGKGCGITGPVDRNICYGKELFTTEAAAV